MNPHDQLRAGPREGEDLSAMARRVFDGMTTDDASPSMLPTRLKIEPGDSTLLRQLKGSVVLAELERRGVTIERAEPTAEERHKYMVERLQTEAMDERDAEREECERFDEATGPMEDER